MATRPPADTTDDVPDTIAFGIAALAADLDDAAVRYPVEANDLVARLDDPEVPYDARGHSVALSEALEHVPAQDFEAEHEVLNALHPVFESYRERGGLLDRLRALLPV
jgi:hypothetical protein